MADRVPLVLGTDANGQLIFEELPAGDSICAPICGLYAGVDGAQGPTGPAGPPGPQGDQGPPGPGGSGTTGDKGAQGPTGSTGPTGPTGAQGAQGAQGEQGEPGTTGEGFTGIKISGSNLFVTPVATNGGLLTSLDLGVVVGSDGDQGNPGPQGPQGAQGTQGLQGEVGGQGPQGAQGDQGLQGIQGVEGPQGAQGPTGPTGAQGAQGDQGDQGPPGTQGPQGAQGAQGIQGEVGSQGPQGAQGAQGIQGIQGIQGVEGPQGAQGDAGPGDRLTVESWSLASNPDGAFFFTGSKPVNGRVLKYITPAGGSGGIEFKPDLIGAVPGAPGEVSPEPIGQFNFAGGLYDNNGNFMTGSTGSVSMLLVPDGVTLAGTGSGHIAADRILKSDGTSLDVTALPVDYFAGAVGGGSSDVTINTSWQKLGATFRAVNATDVNATNVNSTNVTATDLTVNGTTELKQQAFVGAGLTAVGHVEARNNVDVSGDLTVEDNFVTKGTGAARANFNVSGDLGVAGNDNVEGNLNLDGSAVITKYPRMLAIGTSTGNISNTDVDMTWSDSNAAAMTIADDTGTLVIPDSNTEEIRFLCDGDYQIDVTCRCQGNSRVELFINPYIDLNDGTGWRAIAAQVASNYALRDLDQDTGGVTLSTMMSLTAGQKLKFVAHADADATAVLLTNGTLLRIIKLPTP